MVEEAWEVTEILFNGLIEDLCNQERYNVAREMENYRDTLKTALQIAGYEL